MNFSKKAIAVFAFAMATRFFVMGQSSDNWINIELETPGTLGVEILYQADKLSDVTHLRISGALNDNDWGNIKNLSSIQEIDLKNAITASIPASAFKSKKTLKSVVLPSAVMTLGAEAFRETAIDKIDLPLTVKSIGNYCFSSTKIKSVVFLENNEITSLGTYIFSSCDSLKKVVFPKEMQVTTIPERTFSSCANLSEITLPMNLKSIGKYAFNGCSSLKLIDLPESVTSIGEYAFYSSGIISLVLPENLTTISQYAFGKCRSLENIVIPTRIHTLPAYLFEYDTALKSIICKSPNPPALGTSPFYNVTVKNISVTVPDFAVADYKLNDDWLKFASIQGGATSDFWDINGSVSLTNNRRFDGIPSVTLQSGGILTIGGSEPQPMKIFNLIKVFSSNNQGSTSSQFLNSCASVSAENTKASYSVKSGYWCFISLPFNVKVSDIYHSDETASFVVRYYDGATRAANDKTGSSWKDLEGDVIINRGQGFILQTNKDGYVYFPCVDNGNSTIFNPNSVTVALEANKAASSANTGWNFVANPFATFFDLYYAMLDCPITVYDQSSRKYVAYSLIDDNVVLSPNRPFFIQASDDITEIVFSTQGRQLNSTVDHPVEASYMPSRKLFDLCLKYNDVYDNARVVINDDASMTYELNRDASKFFSENADIPQIFTISPDGDYLAINERPMESGNVNIGFYAPAEGRMSLSFSRMDGVVILKDNKTGKEVMLEGNEEYIFDAEEKGWNYARFTMIMPTSGIDEIIEENFSSNISVKDNKIFIQGMVGKRISVISLDGKKILENSIELETETYILPSGIYVVKCGDISVKCAIK